MKFYSWTVQIEVEASWVADGFELTEDRLKGMIEREIEGSYPSETKIKILEAPNPEAIKKEQGE